MEYLQHLLQQYHSGKATEAERAELLTQLEAQGIQLQEALAVSFGDGLDTARPSLAAERAEMILRKMHIQLNASATAPAHQAVVRPFYWKAIAGVAAVLLLMLAGWQWMRVPGIATNTVTTAHTNTAAALQLVRNHTAKKETMLLPDSSVVVLSPGSVLSYVKGFDSLHRSLYLQGEACFNVAKDAKRPFTVYANGIATTALGTRFSVSTFYSNEQVRVRLIEGKVVVRMQENKPAMQPVYLIPGQECMVNSLRGEALVQAFRLKPSGKAGVAGHPDTATPAAAALEFEREPLVNVFKRIEKLYHVSVAYKGVKLGGLSFTGTFLPTDSLPVVLSIICKTNDLAFQQNNSLITITSLP